MFKERRILFVLLLMLALLVACEKKTKFYQGVGTVEEIDRSHATLQLNHEAIEGYMPAMSMPYKVKDVSLLDTLKTGDRVEFSIEDGAKGLFVIAMKKAGTEKPQDKTGK